MPLLPENPGDQFREIKQERVTRAFEEAEEEGDEEQEEEDTGPMDVETLSRRVRELEDEILQLHERIPITNLLNQQFVPRAFAVFGHGLFVYALVVVPILLLLLLFQAGRW